MKTVNNENALLWHKYKKEGDPKAREELILSYVPLVKYAASRLKISLQGHFEFDDLVSAGVYGLICAVDRFDPNRGVKFETFALARIRGAILDWLRSLNWMPQSIRNKARKLEKAMLEVGQKLGREPKDHEIAAYLGCSLKNLQKIYQEVAPTTLISLEECFFADKEGFAAYSLKELIPDVNAENPVQEVEREEIKNLISQAIARLPEKEKLVVALYYYEGLTMKEIGEVMDVSESRICQLHTKAILRMRGYLGRKKKMMIT